MTRIPQPTGLVTSVDLRARFPGWAIGFDERHRVWTAERRAGTALRFLVADWPAELAVKLEAADRAG